VKARHSPAMHRMTIVTARERAQSRRVSTWCSRAQRQVGVWSAELGTWLGISRVEYRQRHRYAPVAQGDEAQRQTLLRGGRDDHGHGDVNDETYADHQGVQEDTVSSTAAAELEQQVQDVITRMLDHVENGTSDHVTIVDQSVSSRDLVSRQSVQSSRAMSGSSSSGVSGEYAWVVTNSEGGAAFCPRTSPCSVSRREARLSTSGATVEGITVEAGAPSAKQARAALPPQAGVMGAPVPVMVADVHQIRTCSETPTEREYCVV